MTSALENKTADKKRLTDQLSSLKKQSDVAKKAAKSAKSELKDAKQKFKDAKRAAKKLRKSIKALESELSLFAAKKAGKKRIAKKPLTRRSKKTGQSTESVVVVTDAVAPADQAT